MNECKDARTVHGPLIPITRLGQSWQILELAHKPGNDELAQLARVSSQDRFPFLEGSISVFVGFSVVLSIRLYRVLYLYFPFLFFISFFKTFSF